MKQNYFFLLSFLFTGLGFAQVGIGTTQPEEMLHVVGDLKIEGTSPDDAVKLVGADDNGTLTSLPFSRQIRIVNNKIELVSSSEYRIGAKNLAALLPAGSGNPRIDNLSLDLGPGQANEGKTVILITGYDRNITITGFTGGEDGMHIFFYTGLKHNVTFDNLRHSQEVNQINALANPSVSLTGGGVAEFIYDGVTKKWILLSLQN
ncbi:hypothetical protein [Leeuwenhoekiella sp. H156]|uniref:hypothetical protein n=1 Tax=Leeuwenhoekiella sp. H156 TaxID=3450128 RepID=UPI003FA45951